jgi:hypothetical protein
MAISLQIAKHEVRDAGFLVGSIAKISIPTHQWSHWKWEDRGQKKSVRKRKEMLSPSEIGEGEV